MPHSHFIYFVVPSEEDKERMLLGVKNLDRNLGPYPFQAWSKWVSLSSRLRSHHPLLDGVISRVLQNLGPYPLQAWSKWVTLSSRLRSHHPLFRWRNF